MVDGMRLPNLNLKRRAALKCFEKSYHAAKLARIEPDLISRSKQAWNTEAMFRGRKAEDVRIDDRYSSVFFLIGGFWSGIHRNSLADGYGGGASRWGGKSGGPARTSLVSSYFALRRWSMLSLSWAFTLISSRRFARLLIPASAQPNRSCMRLFIKYPLGIKFSLLEFSPMRPNQDGAKIRRLG
jgi:hypothetical protein